MVLEFLGFGVIVIVVLGGFAYFGQYLPVMPVINQWKIKVYIKELRGNDSFIKEDRARHIKQKDGISLFQLKKLNITIPARKFSDIKRNSSGKDYIELVQPSRNILLSMNERIKINNSGTETEMGTAEVDKIVEAEETFIWKGLMIKEQARKIIKQPDGWLERIQALTPIIYLITLAVFFILMVDPISKYIAVSGAFMERIEATSLRLEEREDRFMEREQLILQQYERLQPLAEQFGGNG